MEAPNAPVFEIVGGPEQGRQIPVPPEGGMIGRNPACAIVLTGLGVDDYHCQLLLENNRFVLKDLASQSGTLVNDKPIRETALKPGDLVTMGECRLCFLAASEAGAPQPAAVASQPSPGRAEPLPRLATPPPLPPVPPPLPPVPPPLPRVPPPRRAADPAPVVYTPGVPPALRAQDQDKWKSTTSISELFSSIFTDNNIARFRVFVAPVIIKYSWRIASILCVLLSPWIFLTFGALSEEMLGIRSAIAAHEAAVAARKERVASAEAFVLRLRKAASNDKWFTTKLDPRQFEWYSQDPDIVNLVIQNKDGPFRLRDVTKFEVLENDVGNRNAQLVRTPPSKTESDMALLFQEEIKPDATTDKADDAKSNGKMTVVIRIYSIPLVSDLRAQTVSITSRQTTAVVLAVILTLVTLAYLLLAVRLVYETLVLPFRFLDEAVAVREWLTRNDQR